MNILAVDTSSNYLSVALRNCNKTVHTLDRVDNRQSLAIIPAIQALLEQCNIGVRDLSYIVYNCGPGSFTGLRIGLSVIKGIALGCGIKLIPISGFLLFSHVAKMLGYAKVVVGLDARLDQLYVAGVNCKNLQYFLSPQLIEPGEMPYIADAVLIGNGFTAYESKLPQLVLHQDKLDETYPNAEHLIAVAETSGFNGVGASEADLLYIRDKIALNLIEQKAFREAKST